MLSAAAMPKPGTARSLLMQLFGHPEFRCGIPASPPFVLERYRAIIDLASIPPCSEPLLMVHTAGKPLSYRAGSNDTTRQSLPGLATFVPAGVSSRLALRGVGEGMAIHFDGARHVPAWLASNRDREPVTFVDNVIVALAQQMARIGGEAQASDAYLGALGNALLAQLCHVITRRSTSLPLRGSRSSLLLAHVAVQHIQGHLEDSLSVGALAGIAGVGATHFSNTFKRVTGMTPHHYILRARIERACELLRMTSLSIGEIASAVGFAGQSHFCKAFGRQMGVTPSHYRRSGRGPAAKRDALPGVAAGRRQRA
jgi:AraC family transcriptional regulator